MLAAIVVHLNANDAGPGSYSLAAQIVLLPNSDRQTSSWFQVGSNRSRVRGVGELTNATRVAEIVADVNVRAWKRRL